MITNSFRLLIALVFLCAGAVHHSHAQTAAADSPAGVIREFYKWYVTTLKSDKDPFTDGRSEMKRFATSRLIAQIEKARKSGDVGSDPFLDAQDFDAEWAKNIKVSDPVTKGDVATANVELRGTEMGAQKLQVTMRQEGGAWKVDKVAGK